jgi:hypothetical protein
MEQKQNLPEEDKQGAKEGLTLDQLQLRRSDHDDARDVETFVEVGKRAAYLRVYSNIDILHLVETSFLSITVLTGEGKVVAFAAFDHSPLV